MGLWRKIKPCTHKSTTYLRWLWIINFGFLCDLSYRKLGGLVLSLRREYGFRFAHKGHKVQQLWESWHQTRVGEKTFTCLKMNYWLTTINMPWARRPAYNTAGSIRVFIMCGYWSLRKEWIIFHAAYVSAKKKVAEGLGSLIKEWDVLKVNKCTEPQIRPLQ